MAGDLKDRYETSDGSRPDASPLADAHAKQHPLTAFTVLAGGDVFESAGQRPGAGTEQRARAYVDRSLHIAPHGASEAQVDGVRRDLVKQLSSNAMLLGRMELAKPVDVDLVPAKKSIAAFGYPKGVSRTAAGLFWNAPDWDRARMALRQEHLETEQALVFHEMAHAIHYLGFTKAERELIYRVLRPTFGSRAAMDEVFAIYSERELAGAYGHKDKRAPGVYGFTRRQWDENHVFTRFVRKLYFPYKPAAGHKMSPLAGGGWMQGIGTRRK